jgi:hypothetical protein
MLENMAFFTHFSIAGSLYVYIYIYIYEALCREHMSSLIVIGRFNVVGILNC